MDENLTSVIPHPCYISNSTVFTSNPSIVCIVLNIFLSLLSVSATCGNLLVIISIIYFKQLHNPTNYLILSLAVADLLVGVLVFPFNMAFTLALCMTHEDLLCQIRNGFDVSLCTSSILNLCCISIDRYYAVCQPLTYRAKINVQVTMIMILVTWSISVLTGIVFVVVVYNRGICEEMCSVNLFVVATTVLSFYLPAVIMVCIYLKIFVVAWKQVNIIQNTTCQSTRSGTTVSKMERKATKTLATVMGVFLLCLSPFFLSFVFQPVFQDQPSDAVNEALNWLVLSNSTLNPFIYAFFYKWFRFAFKMIISGKILQGDFSNSRLF